MKMMEILNCELGFKYSKNVDTWSVQGCFTDTWHHGINLGDGQLSFEINNQPLVEISISKLNLGFVKCWEIYMWNIDYISLIDTWQ
jgi:hypothetical protein